MELLQRQMEIELQDIDLYRIDELLKAVPFLAQRSLDDMIYIDLVQVMRYEHHRKGEYIYKHGDYADRFYIMLRGRASLQLPKSVLDERARMQREDEIGV
jgi:CRP-like cAMP-binding protein